MDTYFYDMADGLMCSQCGVYFKDTHGEPVLCKTCWKDYREGREGMPAQLEAFTEATLEEIVDES